MLIFLLMVLVAFVFILMVVKTVVGLFRGQHDFEQEMVEMFELRHRMSNAQFQSSVLSSLRKMKK